MMLERLHADAVQNKGMMCEKHLFALMSVSRMKINHIKLLSNLPLEKTVTDQTATFFSILRNLAVKFTQFYHAIIVFYLSIYLQGIIISQLICSPIVLALFF